MKIFLFVSLLLLITSAFADGNAGKTILVILAHPDDETTIGPVMAKYARTGKVYYIVATDGRYGTRVSKLPEDSLIKIRKKECICSCSQLGIESPIMLGFHDGLGIKTGVGEYFKQTVQLRDSLRRRIAAIHPDLIITFGPDGDTGHPDHRVIGAKILHKRWTTG